MQVLLWLIIVGFSQSEIVAAGSFQSDSYAVKALGTGPSSIQYPLKCGQMCSSNGNCTGYFLDDASQGTCQFFIDGQVASNVGGKGTYYTKLSVQSEVETGCSEGTFVASDPPTKCLDVYSRDGCLTPGGTYTIDPDGPTGEDPISATCTIDEDLTVSTEISHDRQTSTAIPGGNNGWEPNRSYSWGITYRAPTLQLEALADLSAACRLHAHFYCYDVNFGFYGWTGRDATAYDIPDGSDICPPNQEGVKTCNCSANAGAWLTDAGYFNDKARFPVRNLLMGDLGSSVERITITLGPMECQDTATAKCPDPPTVLFTTKDVSKQAAGPGYTNGDDVVYTCYPGLRYPDGTTHMTTTCMNGVMWLALAYAECGL